MSDGGDVLEGLGQAARELLDQLEDAGARQLRGLKQRLAEVERGRGEGGLTAEVTTAVPLTEAERERLEGRLRSRHGQGLPIKYRVDPAILGGVVVRLGDQLLDGSVAARLGQLRQTLVGRRYQGR